ncbi:MAG TPA: YncE family protein [Bryobacteraceae bacterium]|nr:YncE family protein [Bryobacteraceae bacterium]
MTPTLLSRRNLLLCSAAAVACRKQKATGYPGYCFVANSGGHSIGVLDLTTFRVLRQIHLSAAPIAVLPHPTRPKAFALLPDTGTLAEIDATSLSVSRHAAAGARALAMQLAPTGDAMWVLYSQPAALVEFPLDSLRPRRRISLSAPPDEFMLSSTGAAAIISRAGRSVAIASLGTGRIEHTITSTAEPSIVCFQPDGKQLIAGSWTGRSITIFDMATAKTVVRLPLPMAPRQFCFEPPPGGQLFVSGDGMDAVAIVYPYTTEVGETILAGHAPGAMATTIAGSASYLLVANPDSSTVTVLDIDTRKLVALVQVGQQPGHIFITPDKQYALVLDEKSGDLAVIRIAALAARRYKIAPLFTLVPIGDKPVSAAVVAFA